MRRRLIINNDAGVDDFTAMGLVMKVVEGGLASEDGKAYWNGTVFLRDRVAVYAKRNHNDSHTFTITKSEARK